MFVVSFNALTGQIPSLPCVRLPHIARNRDMVRLSVMGVYCGN